MSGVSRQAGCAGGMTCLPPGLSTARHSGGPVLLEFPGRPGRVSSLTSTDGRAEGSPARLRQLLQAETRTPARAWSCPPCPEMGTDSPLCFAGRLILGVGIDMAT